MKSLAFSLTTLKRDWRSGEIRLIAVALIIAVSAVTTVNFFVERLRQAMETEAGTVLGGDLVVESRNPLPENFITKAHTVGLETTQTVSFRSMIPAGDRLQLTEVKAVEENYPLRGQLMVGEDPFAQPTEADHPPTPGTVWLDPQLAPTLERTVGDQITLGRSSLVVDKLLLLEPDRGGQLFNIAPRLLMNLEDVERTGLLQPGSQARYRLLLAGPHKEIISYKHWAKNHLPENSRVMGVRDGRPQLRTALQRADQFLTLAALTSVFLAGVAIAIAARRYADRHQDNCAVMRCLGATQGLIIQIYALTMVWLGLVTSLIGCGVAWLAQSVLAHLMSHLFQSELPPASLWPLLTGTLTGLIALLGFALPPLMRLKDVPPSRVLRRDTGASHQPVYTVYLGALIAIAALIPWQSGEMRLTLYVLGGSILTVLVLAAWSWLLISGLKLLRSRVGVAWRYGFASVARRAGSSTVQTIALGLGIMVMLLLTVVRSDLLANWRANLPPDAPNHFMINIQPDQVEAVQTFFAHQGQPVPPLYPNIHGRLVAINDTPIKDKHYSNSRARHLARREFHLTWARELQADNQIVAGRWWSSQESEPPQFSVEADLAETLGIKLGDSLTFQVADQKVMAPVTSLRAIEWSSFNPNFFVMASPGLLNDAPGTYLTSFYLPEEDKPLLIALVKQFPSVTILDVEALMGQVRAIIDRVTLAVEFIFAFTVAAGVVVLFAAIQSTNDERFYESAVFRTLGASRGTIIRGLAAEFLSLGAVAGTVAAIGALAIGYLLAERVLHTGFQFNGWLLVLGLLAGSLGVSLAGLLGTRSVLHAPPFQTLRQV
ncbi:ABC transporter permease [Nitrosococcus wardiae]|uniref:FtsX-like permease family protein n=1 Tax=Nitrosococcus wardiae TaxID=1814290 RepID=A0A4V1AVZ1_9GAMM|nr:FtsX-like permease family protein [Nitrosococcus wardiae]QBQ54815.1 FtsX-like permease family protein [Nitrosococcus wardiae]